MRILYAHLATLANGLCGVGALAYLLGGNKLWAGLLIVSGVGFDGLDGFFARKAGGGGGRFGRWADSIADAITFGLAPAAFLIVHTDHPETWTSLAPLAVLVASMVAGLAIARLGYFSLRGYQRADFLGVPTPQTALAIVALSLWGDVPAFAGIAPLGVLALAAIAALLMVVPLPYPKIRRGSRLRTAMTVTAVAFVVAEIPIQFRPAGGSVPYDLALLATVVASAGLLAYYLLGPLTVPRATEGG